ncbi:MAG: GvpL/GvpF family gas vesicle protein, partial [Dolichospermum sp.]
LKPQTLEEPEPLERGGRDYFLAKKQRYQDQNNFRIDQAAEKQNLIDSISKVNQLPFVIQEKEEEVNIYLLVKSQDKTLLLEQFLNWQKACPRWDLLLGDPLPPYHFI